MTRRPWTERELRILRKRYPDERAADVAQALGRPLRQVYQAANRYGLSKSEAFKSIDLSARIRRGKQHPNMVANQFEPGLTPWNKGKPGSTGLHPNSRKTQFKKGRKACDSRNYVPIGTERVSKDGCLERKTTDDPSMYPARRWVPVARLVWEAEHGTIPKGHVVRFKDGMHTTVAEDITTDKLECISFAENMRRNSYHRYPKPIPQMIQLRGALNRKINNRKKKETKT